MMRRLVASLVLFWAMAVWACPAAVAAPPVGPKCPGPARSDGAGAPREADIYRLDAVATATCPRWRIEASHPVLDLPPPTPISGSRCPEGEKCGVIWMTIPLRDGALLAGKTTRITLVWSAMKSGWADQAVGLRVNGSKWAIGQTRPTQPSVVGRTISIDVPAVSVRKSDRLRIEVFVGERKEGRGQASWARADALKLEVRP